VAAPIAFMVMPFNEKPTEQAKEDVPAKVDFDALWERVYKPVLTESGYEAVRADRDVGALIILEMIQRLAIADLVVADITLPNANVYYEVGIRHAAKRHGCVLVAADWAQPVFDLRQIRQLRFPLRDGAVGEPAAAAARAVLLEGLEALSRGSSPVFDAVPGYPDEPDLRRVSAFREAVAQLSEFETDVRAIRIALPEERPQLVRELLARHGGRAVVRESVVMELIRLVRDNVGWQDVLDYIGALPEHVAHHPAVLEQQALALSYTGDIVRAAAQLEELIDSDGETAERRGLLGGRYWRLYQKSGKRLYLQRAIESYERGMILDLNNYYPSSNLPRLYRERGDPGDDQRASEAETATALACRAALELGTADEWIRMTLLVNAFDRGDVAEAVRLRRLIEADGPDAWKLGSMLKTLESSIEHQRDETVRAGLGEVLAELEELLPAAG
jgi:hypothetical protein